MKSIFRHLRRPGGRAWIFIPGLLVLLAVSAAHTSRATAQPPGFGTLAVQKQLVDANGAPVAGDLSGFVFTVNAGGGPSQLPATNALGQTQVFLAAGTYSITEQPKPGATLVGFFSGTTPIANVPITAGMTTAINARNQVAGNASISITKQIVDANGVVLTAVDRSGFVFTITGTNGASQTATTDVNGAAAVTNLAAATYTITEQARAGFTFVGMTINGVSVANGGSFNLTAGTTAQVVVQDRQGGGNTVTVTKQIVDANGNPITGTVSGFQITVTCGTAFSQQVTTDANGVASFANVPAGACTVTEAVPSGSTLVSITVGGSTANIGNGGSFTVTAGQATAITVRNRTGGATEQVQLFAGCNNVASTYPNGTATSTLAANVSPSPSLIAFWFFINSQQRFVGFSPIPNAPNDLVTVNRNDALFICMNGPGTFTRPII